VAKTAGCHGPFHSILELGGRDVNGTVRPLFRGAEYVSIDINPGPCVDIVADATAWESDRRFGAVVCCEVLEHVEDPWLFIQAARRHLESGGHLILTAATDPREPHSGLDGGPCGPDEWYANVVPAELKGWLVDWDDVEVSVDVDHGDIYATAVRP
jgi:SAM-dependent methyltransferase